MPTSNEQPTHATVRIGHPFNIERRVRRGTKIKIEFSGDEESQYDMTPNHRGAQFEKIQPKKSGA